MKNNCSLNTKGHLLVTEHNSTYSTEYWFYTTICIKSKTKTQILNNKLFQFLFRQNPTRIYESRWYQHDTVEQKDLPKDILFKINYYNGLPGEILEIYEIQ